LAGWPQDEEGLTALAHAARAGRLDSARILIQEGAHLLAKVEPALFLLYYLSCKGQPKKMSFLVLNRVKKSSW
jgi:hypothetical protein